MLKSLFAAIAIFLASIFGGHQVAAPSQPARAAAATQHPLGATQPKPLTLQLSHTQFSSIASNPVPEIPSIQTSQGIVLGAMTNTFANPSIAQLQEEIVGLQVQISQLMNAKPPTTYPSGAPAVQTFLGNTIPVWSKYWSEASISSIANLIALITVPVPHRRPG